MEPTSTQHRQILATERSSTPYYRPHMPRQLDAGDRHSSLVKRESHPAGADSELKRRSVARELSEAFPTIGALYFVGVGVLLLVDPGERGTRLLRRLWADKIFPVPEADRMRLWARVLGSGFLSFGLLLKVLVSVGLMG